MLNFYNQFKVLLLFAFITGSQLAKAQNLNFENLVPAEITVCGAGGIFTVEFVNISGGTLSNLSINVDLPSGINYEAGSLSEATSHNVQEQNISNLNNVFFSCNNLAAGATVTFTFQATADFNAFTAQTSGTIFTNDVTVSYDGGMDSDQTSSYNVLYAALTITTVSPTSKTIFVGGSYTREVTIVNGGYGSLSSFYLEDIHDNNSTISASNIGTLNVDGNQISFDASDFTSIGNGDGLFDRNEAITVTQTIDVSGCNSFESELTAYWGCTGQVEASNKKYPYTTVVLYAPSLSFTPTASFNTCIDGSADNQQLVITNNGTGPANNLEVEISPKEGDQYTRTDVTNITLTDAQGMTTITPSNTSNAVGYDCLGTNPKDGFTLTIPPIQPGETVTLSWNNYTCATTFCGEVPYVGWAYDATYTDMCYSRNYTKNGTGQEAYKKKMVSFLEVPSDLGENEEGLYTMIITASTFKLPEETGAYFEAEFDVPEGLAWSGNAADLTYASGATTWNAQDIYFNTNTRKLTAKYLLPIPNNFNLVNSAFDLKLTNDCSAGTTQVTFGARLFYVMDPDCNPVYRVPMTCYESGLTQLHCPGNCEHGLAFERFAVTRTSLGISDNDLDGLPDATDAPDFSKIKRNRIMVSDTFETVFTGTVHTSATYPSWAYAYAKSQVPYGDEIEIISAAVTIVDASTNQTLTCDNVNFVDALVNSIRTVDFDFSPATLFANACNDFDGFVLEDADQVTLTAVYHVVDNPGGITELVTIENDFYVSDTENAAGFQCNDWNGNFTLIGYFYNVNSSDQYNIKTCTKTIKQNYRMSIGACCSNYAGGNLFPYEYRNWANIKNLRVEIPEGYSLVSGQMEQWRTLYTNKTKKETVSISPDSISGTSHYFNLENYHVSNGGGINLSDDGFRGRISLDVKPNCDVNEATNLPMTWHFTFQENAVLGGSETVEYAASTADYLKYFRAELDLSTNLPTQEAAGPLVSWDIKVNCKNADAENGWLSFDYATNDIGIVEVYDVAADTAITSNNGYFYIGDMNLNNSKNYRLTVNYNSCNSPQLKVRSGYHCDGYGAIDLACGYDELALYIVPQSTELQVKFNSEITGGDECGSTMSVELEMLSAKLSSVEDLFVDVVQSTNQTITIVPGSVSALYPEAGTYSTISDPTYNLGTYTITGASMDSIIGVDGLVGITDVTMNIVKVKFDLLLDASFRPGDFLTLNIGGNEPCGAALPTLSLAIDPNATVESISGAGLNGASDNWAMAWGDYDNDGNVDLFVTNYAEDQPNQLYHNNGNGTFTQVSPGPIATDTGISLGATWGDYDNDGDLDLFIANNIGTKNWLYRNEGSGNFTKIENDPVSNYDGYSHGVSWVDYDNDGYLDLFVADYFSTRFNHLYHNNGDGTFSDVTTATPVLESSSSISGIWGDYNNDGLPDLFVSNINNENNALFKNKGNGDFEKISTGAIVNDGGNSVGASWGDYNNDGYLDLFVTNAGNNNNFLYRNNGDETFTKITTGAIVNDGGHSHGSAWGDYDNDGDLDLFVSNDNSTYNFLYSNNGDGTFTKLTNGITEAISSSFGAAWADYDNDLDIDLFVANRDGQENKLYANSRGRCQNKACLVLVGTNSNYSAIGAKVRLKANIYGQDIWQLREISAQTGGGIGGQNDMKMLIGLGDATTIDSLIIEWPSGYTQVVENASVNNCLTITEDQGGKICGVAYYDENGNCTLDQNEQVLSNMSITVQPGNQTVVTNDSGAYTVYVDPGTYTVTQAGSTLWSPTCNTSHTVEVLQMGQNYCGFNIGNTPVSRDVDLSVEVNATPCRIGEENLIALTYCNQGTRMATNIELKLFSSTESSFVESSVPWDSYASDTATWNIDSLIIGACYTIYVKNLINPTTEVGTLVTMGAIINGQETETNTSNNNDDLQCPAVGSFDPNDILVNPEGYIEPDQDLTYTIRFQNVGNSPANTVMVIDQLPEELDMSTFQMGIASHGYRLDIQDNNVLVWTFENINLIDSTTNEALSNGYIIFKIKPRFGLEEGTEILNDAAIYFDNNEPIHTNTVVNTIGEEPETTLGSSGDPYALSVFPNPMNDHSEIRLIDQNHASIKITGIALHELTGRKLINKKGLSLDNYRIEKGLFAPGYYILRVRGENNKEYVSKLIIH